MILRLRYCVAAYALGILSATTAFPVSESQRDSCGKNAIKSVLWFAGKLDSLPKVDPAAANFGRQMSFADLKEVSNRVGFPLRGVRLGKEDFLRRVYPAIVPWGENHFAVLLKVENGNAFISDPPNITHKVPLEVFEKKSSNLALIPEKPLPQDVQVGVYAEIREVEGDSSEEHFVLRIFNDSQDSAAIVVKSVSCGCIIPEVNNADIPAHKYVEIPFKFDIKIGQGRLGQRAVIDVEPSLFGISVVDLTSTRDIVFDVHPRKVNFPLRSVGDKDRIIVRISHAETSVVTGRTREDDNAQITLVKISSNPKLSFVEYNILWKSSGGALVDIPIYIENSNRSVDASIQAAALIRSERLDHSPDVVD